MKDAIIAGNGNSRYLKSVSNFLTLYPNYSSFVAALVSGSLPIDLNGINEAGYTQVGTPLNKKTFLEDQTAEAISAMLSSYSSAPSTPNEALALLTQIAGENIQLETGSYAGTGGLLSYTFTRRPKYVWIWYDQGDTLSNRHYTISSPFFYFTGNEQFLEAVDAWSNVRIYVGYSWSGNTLSITRDQATNPSYPFNQQGRTYYYLAICGAPLRILSQPVSVSAALNTDVQFKVIAGGTGLRYTWQTSPDNGVTWSNSALPGYATNTLTVGVVSNRNGYKFRCIVTDDTGNSLNSNAATLTIAS